MKNEVFVYLKGQAISVDGEHLPVGGVSLNLIKDVLPNTTDFNNASVVGWASNLGLPEKGYIALANGTPFVFDEVKYSDIVQPYVDLWQAEKDRLDAEQAAREAEYNSFEATQARALSKLNTDFEKAKEEAYVTSSLGFKADANSTANENVNGLLVTVGDGTVSFCDYNNEFHELNKSQLETLRSEIISNAQSLYTQKWTYRTAIEQCETNEQIEEALAQVKFTYEDFAA